jgi:hypothetical protein
MARQMARIAAPVRSRFGLAGLGFVWVMALGIGLFGLGSKEILPGGVVLA